MFSYDSIVAPTTSSGEYVWSNSGCIWYDSEYSNYRVTPNETDYMDRYRADDDEYAFNEDENNWNDFSSSCSYEQSGSSDTADDSNDSYW